MVQDSSHKNVCIFNYVSYGRQVCLLFFYSIVVIMPLFLFMTGTSMPFSFSKFKDDPNKGPIYRKILKRFIFLFIWGMIVQGNLLGLDTRHIYIPMHCKLSQPGM